MNLERLRAVQAEEREADSLRALPDSFYREVADYVEGLREERAGAAEAAEDPFDSEEVRRLTEEIEAAEEVAEAIYERRVGKLVKRASLAAAGMPTDEEGLTNEEAELFATLVDRIEAHREDVLAAFDGDRDLEAGGTALAEESSGLAPDYADEAGDAARDADDAEGGTPADAPPRSADDGPGDAPPVDPAPDAGGDSGTGANGEPDGAASEPSEGGAGGSSGEGPGEATDGDRSQSPDDAERLTLRITADVGEVFGVDERVYDLAAEDVVTLPAANAKPLLERDAAERVD